MRADQLEQLGLDGVAIRLARTRAARASVATRSARPRASPIRAGRCLSPATTAGRRAGVSDRGRPERGRTLRRGCERRFLAGHDVILFPVRLPRHRLHAAVLEQSREHEIRIEIRARELAGRA